jgi:hypothetical protein
LWNQDESIHSIASATTRPQNSVFKAVIKLLSERPLRNRKQISVIRIFFSFDWIYAKKISQIGHFKRYPNFQFHKKTSLISSIKWVETFVSYGWRRLQFNYFLLMYQRVWKYRPHYIRLTWMEIRRFLYRSVEMCTYILWEWIKLLIFIRRSRRAKDI